MTATVFTRGIRENRVQVAHQLIQVMLVGFAIGMTRTVVPALADSEFGLERGSFLLLASFVLAFGAVKAVMNFVAGRWSERIGCKRVLFWGWAALAALVVGRDDLHVYYLSFADWAADEACPVHCPVS